MYIYDNLSLVTPCFLRTCSMPLRNAHLCPTYLNNGACGPLQHYDKIPWNHLPHYWTYCAVNHYHNIPWFLFQPYWASCEANPPVRWMHRTEGPMIWSSMLILWYAWKPVCWITDWTVKLDASALIWCWCNEWPMRVTGWQRPNVRKWLLALGTLFT